MPRTAATGLTAALLSCAALPGAADDLFSITATNGGTTVTETDADVLDLSEAAIESLGAFAPLGGTNFVATLDYAGVANAATYTVNAAGNSATLAFPITGFSRTFAGTDPDDLADQIEDFILEDGSDAYADFLKAIRQQSVAAVLDGNPGATTARLARHTFDLYGLGVAGPAWANPNRVVVYEYEDEPDNYPYVRDDLAAYDRQLDGDRNYATNPIAWFEITPTYESNEAGPFDGDTAAVHLAGGYFFNEYLGVSAGGSFAYTDLEGTDVFHSSGHVALNWNVVPVSDWGETSDGGRSNSFGWQLSPFVHSGVGASGDAAAGGAFVGVGLASNVHVGLRDRVVFNWGSQILYAEGIDLEFEEDDDDGDDDVELETDLGQSIVSTGLLITVFLDRPDGNFFIDGGASYSAFLDDAAVDYWVAPEVGLGYRFGRDSRVRLTYRPLFGNADYEAHTAGVNLVFTF